MDAAGMDGTAYWTGLSVGLGLIVAIGAQNAFVLRQGLRGRHVFAVALVCALSDAILIVAAVAGFGALVAAAPWLDPLLRYGGAAFLFWYGARCFHAAVTSTDVLAGGDEGPDDGMGRTLLACLAVTWLNPHVYLDTVVLLGSVSTRFAGAEVAFAAGAVTGSFAFFFTLGYGARWLRPLFARPMAWRVLEAVIGAVMWAIGLDLVRT